MASKRKVQAPPAAAPDESEFDFVLALCRTAIASGDQVQRHSVERLLGHLSASGRIEAASAVEGLLRVRKNTTPMVPVQLTRSFVTPAREALTRGVRIPVDKETAAPLADIVWVEDLPKTPPVFGVELQTAFDTFVAEWSHVEALAGVGVAPTRSMLLYGQPGTGKTHAALWLAGQLGLPAVVARLDGLMSSFLGTTSRNIGNLFDFVQRYECVLVLDEFDAIAKLRDDPQEMGEIKRVVNTLLQRLDHRRQNGITLGLTNHDQLLDPAVWRRFDVQLRIPAPGLEARQAILRQYLAPLPEDESTETFLAWLCADMTGAELEAFVHTYKRLSVLAESAYSNVFGLCGLVGNLHAERMRDDRRSFLGLPELVAAKQLAAEAPSADGHVLATVFGRSKSTITRWLAT